MDLIVERIESSMIVGDGLVFDYQAGKVKRAPVWVQKYGLEWLHMVIKQPYGMVFLMMQFFFVLRIIILVLFHQANH